MSPSPPFPSRDEGFRLHARYLNHDATASADLCAAYIQPLCDWLGGSFRGEDGHLILEAAHDALIGYLHNPAAYDPARGDLTVYLRVAARRDLLNRLQKEKCRNRLRISWNSVENGEEGGNLHGREKEPSKQLEREEEEAHRLRLFASIEEDCSPRERQVLQLMRDGESRTCVYAAALGLEGLPAEQEREVKQIKDRIKKRMQRGA